MVSTRDVLGSTSNVPYEAIENDPALSVAESKFDLFSQPPEEISLTGSPMRDRSIEPEEHEDYEAVLNSNKYIQPKEEKYLDRPYVIPPEEFGELDYNMISLTYYADDVIADDNNEIIDHIDETIGNDAINHFGEYEDDSVYIRNDALECDYEILRSEREYSDVADR